MACLYDHRMNYDIIKMQYFIYMHTSQKILDFINIPITLHI